MNLNELKAAKAEGKPLATTATAAVSAKKEEKKKVEWSTKECNTLIKAVKLLPGGSNNR